MASIANIVGVTGYRLSLVPVNAVVGSGNMTAANPIVVTVSTHGLVSGDHVTFTGIVQANWTALNNNDYVITKLTDNTFSIPTSGVGFGAYTDAVGKIWNNFDSRKYFAQKMRIAGFDFYGSNAADVLIIRDGAYNGAILFKRKDVTPAGVDRMQSVGILRARPFIHWAECTIGGTLSNAAVLMELP